MYIKKSFNLSLLLILLSTLSFGQPGMESIKWDDYPFLNRDDNLIYRNNNESLLYFFRSLDSLVRRGDRKVNIIQIGDSHIQAGFFPNKVRWLFQNNMFFGNGGRGFIFPYKIANTNGPWDYGVRYTGSWEYCRNVQRSADCSFGLAGITVITRDTLAAIELNPNHREGNVFYGVQRVKVFHKKGPESFEPVLLDAKIIEVIEDSLFTEFVLMEEADKVTLVFHKTKPGQTRFELYGFTLESEDPGIIYNSVGVNGADVPAYLRCDLLDDHLKIIDPAMVILSLGANDAYTRAFNEAVFKANLEELITRIKSHVPKAVILLTTPGDAYRSKKYFNYNNVTARDILLDIAASKSLAVWDFFSVMGGPNSIYQWYKAGLASNDKLHLTQAGYLLQGELFYEALLRAYYHYLENENE